MVHPAMFVSSPVGCYNLFLRRENSTSLIQIDAGITFGQILRDFCQPGDRVTSFAKLLKSSDRLVDTFPGPDCHLCVTGHLRGGARRARWESTPEQPGLRLAYPSEICQPITTRTIPEDTWPIQQIHQSSAGITFATFASFENISHIRTDTACMVVLRGYVKLKVLRLGVDDSRVLTTTITVRDVIQDTEELRAVTLVNLARDSDDFFTLPDVVAAAEVAHIERVAMFAEIRSTDASSADWAAFGTPEAFHNYVTQTLENHSTIGNCVLYKIFHREGYLCRRIQVPVEHRDAVYQHSGLKSVQFRAVRKPDVAPESGLEVLRIPDSDSLAEAAVRLSQIPGSLGCFKSQSSLYLRVNDAHIQRARETVFPGDDRFSAFNIAAKCVIPYKVLGFPAGTSMKEVVKTLETLGFVAVPSRIVNLRELAVVFLAAPQPPSANRFQTSAGVIQIIEVERKTFHRKENSMIAPIPPSSSRTPNNHKGNVKGSGKGGRDGLYGPLLSQRALMFPKPAVPLLPNPFADRVDALETQVATLKQDIEAVKKDGADTKQQLAEISSNQNRGFQDLLTAISEIRANMSAAANSSQQNHSPPSKQSPPNKHPRL